MPRLPEQAAKEADLRQHQRLGQFQQQNPSCNPRRQWRESPEETRRAQRRCAIAEMRAAVIAMPTRLVPGTGQALDADNETPARRSKCSIGGPSGRSCRRREERHPDDKAPAGDLRRAQGVSTKHRQQKPYGHRRHRSHQKKCHTSRIPGSRLPRAICKGRGMTPTSRQK